MNSPEIAMNAHLSDSDRQALRLAHDLREELRQALPRQVVTPSVSPFVDPSGRPSVLMRMDEATARAMMALLMSQRAEIGQAPPETRRADGSHVPPAPGQAVPPQQQPPAPDFSGSPQFAPAAGYAPATGYAQAPQTGPSALLPTAFPTY
ncbi:hypothetical protein Acsp03_55080 [Actinomadura sp. NBRC 104412]|nr:hypothetical protein Acsp03_55080 [Actinomadura sp. NBRC 104412]